ncbi:hypothetical protein B0H19DRAFT_1383129 [Mycena capillaripes]|nr:hypothetical protein B0H19DRAFT_1383129 [Mycena capillaripes]
MNTFKRARSFPRRYHRDFLYSTRYYALDIGGTSQLPASPTGTPEKKQLRGPALHHRHPISTLNSAVLKPTDYLDVSSKTMIRIRLQKSDRLQPIAYLGDPHRHFVPFPPHSAGFLYYHETAHASPLEGSVRLRVTPDKEPSSFSRGQDLLLPSGCPWQTILPQISTHKETAGFRDLLLHEKLVTEQQLERCRRVFAGRSVIYPHYILFRLTQEFPVHFHQAISLTTVGKDTLYRLNLNSTFVSTRDYVACYPWHGSALARFERAPVTDPMSRLVRLRFTKILSPPVCAQRNYNGRVLKPEEGELLTLQIRGRAPAPWAYNIDSKSQPGVAFRALWDDTSIQ